ncbi:MAG TPA: hemolysin III family protein [Chitinophagaceae bacterium]|jgi:hemolysin III|nr:hemolysin III family protein [Chitinophagaceae bacterium]
MLAENTPLRLKQEMINSILHGFGILFGIICIPILLTLAAKGENTARIVGASVYGFSFLMVFTFSTLYHGFQQEQVKRAFKILDHIAIYFLIAGTYTPLVLIYQNNNFGIGLLIVLWTLTVIGTVFKIFCCGRWEILSTIIYLMMGWSMLAGGSSFFNPMPMPVLSLVIAGGVLYSLGVIFYIWEKYWYSHAVWHSFVLVAAICHYVAILLSVRG